MHCCVVISWLDMHVVLFQIYLDLTCILDLCGNIFLELHMHCRNISAVNLDFVCIQALTGYMFTQSIVFRSDSIWIVELSRNVFNGLHGIIRLCRHSSWVYVQCRLSRHILLKMKFSFGYNYIGIFLDCHLHICKIYIRLSNTFSWISCAFWTI